jgi:cysteine desulfurase
LHGGNQERDVRSGTINAVGAQALALAVELAVARQGAHSTRLSELRDELVARVKQSVPDAVYNGDPVNRLPGNAHFSFHGAEGEVMLMLLDAHGVQTSTGSACSAGIAQPSHVLIAMGLDPVKAKSSLRFSLGAHSSQTDIDQLIAVLPEVVSRARAAGLVSDNKVSH